MIRNEYEVVSINYKNTSDVPKDNDLFYRCTDCDAVIPSVPNDNIGCKCGNVFIDKDCGRLVVDNFTKFEVVKLLKT